VLVLEARTAGWPPSSPAARSPRFRTAAGSAVAAEALTSPDLDELTVLGSGVQGRAHVRALSRVRPLRRVRILGAPTRKHRRRAAAELDRGAGIEVTPSRSAGEAVAGSPLVVTCHTEPAPGDDGRAAHPWATVISVGSFEAHRSEVPPELVRAARVVVDDVGTALRHAGPVVRGVAAGALRPEDLVSLGTCWWATPQDAPARPKWSSTTASGWACRRRRGARRAGMRCPHWPPIGSRCHQPRIPKLTLFYGR